MREGERHSKCLIRVHGNSAHGLVLCFGGLLPRSLWCGGTPVAAGGGARGVRVSDEISARGQPEAGERQARGCKF